MVCGIHSYGCLIIHLVGAGKNKIANSSIHIYKLILTYDGIKSQCLSISLLNVTLGEYVLKWVRLIGVTGAIFTSKIMY